MLAQPTHPPRAAATVLAGTDEAGLLAQVERCRLAAVPLAHPERQFSLQVFDLGRLRARLGLRWDSLRSRAVGQIRTGLARELGKEELAIEAAAISCSRSVRPPTDARSSAMASCSRRT